MRRIAFMNQKGGVGKTTTVANLGAALAERGLRVLAVDIDPQANLTTHLDDGLDLEGPTIFEVLLGEAPVAEAVLTTTTERLDLLPSTLDLAGVEMKLVQAMGRETILKAALEEFFAGLAPEKSYDFLLIDCPPSLGILSVNALTVADEVMVPIQTHFFALRGVSMLLEVVDLVKRKLKPELEITAVIPCIADLRTNLTGEVVEEIKGYFGDRTTKTIVRTNIRLAEAPSHGKTILQYAPDSHGAEDYRSLAEEIAGETPEEEAPVPVEEPPVEEPAPPRTLQIEPLPTALPAPKSGPAD